MSIGTLRRAGMSRHGAPHTGGWLYRWGAFVARHNRAVLALWVLVLIGCALAYPQLSANLQGPDYSVTGSDSARVTELEADHFADLGTEQDALVFDSADHVVDDDEFRRVVGDTMGAVGESQGVVGVIGPFGPFSQGMVSQDRHTAIALVGLGGDARTNVTNTSGLQQIAADHAAHGVDVALTGFSPVTNDLMTVETGDAERAEMIGLPVALAVLVLSLGAAVAAAVPLIAAGAGLLTSFGVLAALSFTTSFDAMLLAIVTMIGTALSIDYALFIVSRVREEFDARRLESRADRTAIADAIGVGMRTAGHTITVSGLIVALSMGTLFLIDSPVFHEIALGVIATVLSVLIVALLLVPAVLAELGPRIGAGRVPRISGLLRGDRHRGTRQRDGLWARWAHAVMRRPVVYGGAALVALVVLVVPIGSISYGINLGTQSLGDMPSGQAADTLSQKFSPGMLSPIQIVATGADDTPLSADGQNQAQQFANVLHTDPRIDRVVPAHSDGRTLWTVVPNIPPDSTRAADLVGDLRSSAQDITGHDAASVQILVGGTPGQFVDLSREMTGKLPVVVTVVLLLALVFLAAVFRSAILPVKAVLLNLLSTGAALGVTVAVFQWGWGSDLLSFESVGYLQVYLPIIVFVMLFGVSMDYEVFLIGRMKEAWDTLSAGDAPAGKPGERNRDAVAAGISHTARPITAAAAIMVVVFASFVSADMLELKEFGLALSVAVAIDAIVIRMVLVPAFMRLLGGANWWPGTTRRAVPTPDRA